MHSSRMRTVRSSGHLSRRGGGFCLSACWDTNPPGAGIPQEQTPPGADHPRDLASPRPGTPWEQTPWNQVPPQTRPPEQTPRDQAPPSPVDRHTPVET